MAYESGKLTGPDQSQIQRWALGYRLSWKKYDRDKESFELKRLLHLFFRATNPRIYESAYPENIVRDVDEPGSVPYTKDDLEDLEKILDEMSRKQQRTAPAQQGDWGDWR